MNEEYKKCLEDPIYFVEKYCSIEPIKLKVDIESIEEVN